MCYECKVYVLLSFYAKNFLSVYNEYEQKSQYNSA